MRYSILLVLPTTLTVMMAPARAEQVAVTGHFVPTQSCEATKRKDGDNPGNVRVEIGRSYAAIARNDTPGTHYQIQVPGAPVTEARWVPMGCGTLAAEAMPPAGGVAPPPPLVAVDSLEAVLAVTWEPAFCTTKGGRGKPECRSLSASRFDATHFSLHGLWPDDLDDSAAFPCYCDGGAPIDCSESRATDDGITLSGQLLDRLKPAMPGIHSGLERHEWAKHGSCYRQDKTGSDAGATPDDYFTAALAALDALNASGVQRLFASRLGERLARDEIESAFDTAFGAGAGKRVQVRCTRVEGENLITELWINLKGDIGHPADLGRLIQAAPPTSLSSKDRGCAGGRVLRARPRGGKAPTTTD